jgi:predicted nucleic acid-binding protein
MAVLVDTNLWIKHFRNGNDLLNALLEDNEVLCHPVVIGELSMGNLPDRQQTLWDFEQLPRPKLASWRETRHLVESRKLFARGLQWNDLILLASCIVSQVPLWTLDSALAEVAREIGVAYQGQ